MQQLTANKTAIVLINLGTPDKPTPKSVKKYLREFLSDARVIELPWPIRFILVNAIIAPLRAKKSAHAYQQIWTKDGSPLLINSQKLQNKLQIKLNNKLNNHYDVYLAMRYGNPKLSDVFNAMQQKNYTRITILPLYPQYASASCGSVLEISLKYLSDFRYFPEICCINEFYSHSSYISAISSHIKYYLNANTIENNNKHHILFSYHGIPEKQLRLNNSNKNCPCSNNQSCLKINNNYPSNCYRAQCYATTSLIAKELNLNASQYTTSFQSRLGKLPWIKPYTDQILSNLINNNITDLTVVSPSFVADCLETLEELNINLKETWLKLGGKNFNYIPCLNDSDLWVDSLINIINNK